MSELKLMEAEYKAKIKEASVISDRILKHLHSYFDDKLKGYTDFEDFLFDINNYAGDSIGKLLYIKYAKDTIEF